MTETYASSGQASGDFIRLRTISLGAGVQSTTMALMAAHGDLKPMPDCAIFADTGWEPKRVYDHLDWLEEKLPFPVHRVRRHPTIDLKEACLKNARGEIKHGKCTTIPAFAPGSDGRAAPLIRQCTRDYKVEPIMWKLRDLVGIKPRSPGPKHPVIEQWIGISTDESHRMKPARERWVETRWPLIMVARMSRWDCLKWLDKHGYNRPGKSSCIGCPYHGNEMWREMRDHDKTSWADAVQFDRAIRNGFKGCRGTTYLHRSLKPLDQVDLSTDAEKGQPDLFQGADPDQFGNECEGLCGV